MTSRRVEIPVDGKSIQGELQTPATPCAVVLFAHGSGSGRKSPRNLLVASHLNAVVLSTLLIDLLTEEEEREDAITARVRFDIGLLSDRLDAAIDWLMADPETQGLPIGLFGASTGAAAALAAAIRHPEAVKAIVCRGGRPDLAGDALLQVDMPCLMLVGDRDPEVLKLNRLAYDAMPSEDKEIRIIEGASHLFSEPGTLEQVAEAAGHWFRDYLCPLGPI